MLQIGSRGSAVVALQKKLGVSPDGIFGPQTEAALKAWQSRNGLTPDGVYGPKSAAKMSGSSGGSSSPSSSSSSTAMSSTDAAAMYGWSLSVINSDPDLKKLFAKAVATQMTPAAFIAGVRNTKWFKTHSDSWRQALILQKADPATYKQQLAATTSRLSLFASQMGASLTAAQLKSMASQAHAFGWDDSTLRIHLAGHLKASSSGYYSADAATAQVKLGLMAEQYGIDVSPSLMARWVKASALGQLNEDEVRIWAIKTASSRYPPLADRLKAGETLMDIANPYMQTYSQTLEVNPNAISLKDPLIQAALSSKDKAGKPVTKSVWEFENDLRRDSRYMKTQQAQDKTMAVGHQVLRDLGLVGS